MIGYVTLGTNNFPRAAQFYDTLLAEVGAKRQMDFGEFVAWGTTMNQPMLCVCKPHDGKSASVGNGVMVALQAKNLDQIKKLHAKALALGGTDEGAPGPRGDSFFCGYVRDLDGNKLNFFCMA
jgi:catechol 2,3-dioxygenase-like lactoylglutathione lyase family enzyme